MDATPALPHALIRGDCGRAVVGYRLPTESEGMMDEMRKAFEAHCARNWVDVDRVMDGPYKDASTQRAWEAWQAATLAERERVQSGVVLTVFDCFPAASDYGRSIVYADRGGVIPDLPSGTRLAVID